MKRTTTMLAAVALAASGATAALAGTSHVLGPGGNPPKLDSQCHRAVMHLKVGHTIEKVRAYSIAANEVNQGQIHCLIRRKDAVRECLKRLGPVPPVVKGHTHRDETSDWKGVDKLRRYVANLSDCVVNPTA